MADYQTYQAEEGCIPSTKVSGLTKISDSPSSLTEEFAYAITDLQEVVSILTSRLDPVLTPDYDCEKACSDTMPPVSPLRVQLHRTHSVTASLRGILSRLEA